MFATLPDVTERNPQTQARCKQAPRALGIPWPHQCLGKASGPLSPARNGLWDPRDSPAPLLLSLVSDFLPLRFISSCLWALGRQAPHVCALPNSGHVLGKRKRAL